MSDATPEMSADPISEVLSRLECAGCRPKRSGRGWMALCPAHDDREASLSVGIGQKGQVLLNCFVGCSVESIVARLGMHMKDLWPDELLGNNGKPKTALKPDASQKVYPTAREAIHAYGLGKPSKWWPYLDAGGNPVMVVARWDAPGGKLIRPVCKSESGWVHGALPPPRPLYNLPEILNAPADQIVVICEGELCADAACKLGFVATTSSGGAASAAKSDWTHVRDREVWVIPDNDPPGLRYAQDVVRLAYEAGARAVRVLTWERLRPTDFQGLPQGYDLADWVERFSRDSDVEKALRALAAHIKAIAAKVPPEARSQAPDVSEPDDDEGESSPPALAWEPYPGKTLPYPLCDLVEAAAESMGCDPSFVALPLLTACAAAVGLTRRLKAKADWAVPPILWSMIIGESGSLKTPALEMTLQWLQAKQGKWFKDYTARRQQYEEDRLAYEKALAEWRLNKKAGERPRAPEPPAAKRIVVADTTIEALAPILQANPRGVLVAHDELVGWVGAFDRYANTQGGDIAFWLSCYNAVPHTVDRRSQGTLSIPNAGVWITGGIQPGTLQRAFTLPLRENGLLARFLLAWPPRRPKRWTEAEIPQDVKEAVGRLFDRLLTLDFDYAPDGEPIPKSAELSPEAKAAYQVFYNSHAQEQAQASGDLAAAFSKLEEIPLRLGLILHLTRWAAGEPVNPDVVDGKTMKRAIALTEWHKHETARIYEILARGFEGNQEAELLEWISRHGGRTTLRALYSCGPRRFRNNPQEARLALDALVRSGRGRWVEEGPSPKGGKPTTVFVLVDAVDADAKPRKSRVFEGIASNASASNASKPENDGSTGGNPNLMPPESSGVQSGNEDGQSIRWVELE